MTETRTLRCGSLTLPLDRTQVMGVLNVTPDSFSDGGRFVDPDLAVQRAIEMVREGASIIDVGGESTRPGAAPVEPQTELERVIPVVAALKRALPDTVISVDTSKAEVMREAVAAGAGLINDVYALRAPGALEAAAQLDAAVCLMHMQGEPRTMQDAPHYDDVVDEVRRFLQQRVEACVQAGIPRQRLVLDPGFGFGKSLEHNLALLRHLDTLQGLELPLLVGLSRKRMLGTLLDEPVEARMYGGVAAAVIACMQGACVVRTHDVKPTVDALRIADAVRATP